MGREGRPQAREPHGREDERDDDGECARLVSGSAGVMLRNVHRSIATDQSIAPRRTGTHLTAGVWPGEGKGSRAHRRGPLVREESASGYSRKSVYAFILRRALKRSGGRRKGGHEEDEEERLTNQESSWQDSIDRDTSRRAHTPHKEKGRGGGGEGGARGGHKEEGETYTPASAQQEPSRQDSIDRYTSRRIPPHKEKGWTQ